MEKSPAEKMNFKPFFIHSIAPIPLNFGQNTDGFGILASNLFYRSSTKRGNGLL
jgi:hypothetical protein